jgi:DNA N-6-adenine-methyltransferase (Dam)
MVHDAWFTPCNIIEPIRSFYGGTIDLDPASSSEANETIKAKHYFNWNLDGLKWEWYGNVWCNPPYCDGAMKEWLLHGARHYWASDTRINQMIFLVNRSDAKWYYEFLDYHVGGYYQFRNRIKFIDGLTGKKSSPRYNNDLIYWGGNTEGFKQMCLDSFGKTVPSSFYC